MLISFLKETAKYFFVVAVSFPLNIAINEKIDSNLLKKFIYIILLPVELIWALYVWISGLLCNACQKDFKYTLSVTAIAKNEALYIDEWIMYHMMKGVEHFYLYDNNSSDGLYDTLKKYIDSGVVTYTAIKGSQRQVDAYNSAIRKYKRETKYMAILDCDEFIQITGKYEKISDVLQERFSPDVAAVALNWCMFGSGHQSEYRDQFVIERFLYRAAFENENNQHVKCVVNPRLTFGFRAAHFAYPFIGKRVIDLNNKDVKGGKTDSVCHSPLRLDHYFTKSYEEFLKKRSRGMADQLGVRDLANFEKYDLNDEYDASMLDEAENLHKYIEEYRNAE